MPVTRSPQPIAERLRAALDDVRASAQDVAAACLLAADELETTGTPPTEDALDACESLLARLERLGVEIRSEFEKAGGFEADSLAPRGADLETLDEALKDLEETLRRRREVAEAVDAARDFLGAVDRIGHADDPQFAPLCSAREMAATLRAELDAAEPDEIPPAATDVWSAAHPLRALLLLVADPDGLDDTQWATFQETVTEAFGRSLGTAVARGRITLDADACGAILQAVQDHDPS